MVKKNYKFNKILVIFLSIMLTFLCSCDLILDNNTNNDISCDSVNSLSVHFLDVGQGDSIFIELPNSQTMLIDAGENYHGEGIINYIKNCGYSKIDYLVATHPHSDHIGSMAYIVRNFEIGEIYMPKVSITTATYENLLNSISKKGLKIKSAAAGMNITYFDDFTADIIAPEEIDEKNLNNSSIVIKMTFGNKSFLFMGDAEKSEINSITADVSADVLKVGHHGSRTSTTADFLERVQPSIAVISCGIDNDYGHPHESTLKFLNDINCEIYRTDKDKTITVTTDGNTLNVQTNGISIERAK